MQNVIYTHSGWPTSPGL